MKALISGSERTVHKLLNVVSAADRDKPSSTVPSALRQRSLPGQNSVAVHHA
ncbi:hypothetical protein FORC11_p0143 (plasmid) [Shigella sonnei]|nr:hypothetical protein FORC11_p0143 [Shigella sonnei]